ncbi:MAG: tetraacyldisaccharide 4'-kinase [Phycisphaeraceae bacterium]
MSELMSGEARGLGAVVARAGLGLLEPLYGAGVWWRNLGYDRGWREVVDLGRPVVSVGNLTTGGTGKTPMVVEVVRRLEGMGKLTGVLLRGYGAELKEREPGGPRAMGSDEAMVYREALGDGVMVAADPDRVRSARWVLEKDAGVDVFVLDDGFQHRRVKRDLDLVLVDAMTPWGFGHLLPRGMMREPVGGLKRADSVVVTRCDRVCEGEIGAIERRVRGVHESVAMMRSESDWTGLRGVEGEAMGVEVLSGRQVYGVCGVGNPAAFAAMLRERVGEVVGMWEVADHHAYSAADVSGIMAAARGAGAELIVTTEKDWVKLEWLVGGEGLPVVRAVLGTRVVRGSDELDRLLAGLFAEGLRA